MKRLSKLIPVILFIALTIGCAGTQLKLDGEGFNRDVVIYTVETLAVPIGYFAAENDLLDTALREAYSLAMEGKLTPDGVNQILEAVGGNDPLKIVMVKRSLRLLELVGAQLDSGLVVSLAGLDKGLIEAAARGYVDGFDTYKITHD